VQPRQTKGPEINGHPSADQRRAATAWAALTAWLELAVPPGQHVLQLAEVIAVVVGWISVGEQRDAIGDERVGIFAPVQCTARSICASSRPAAAANSFRIAFYALELGTRRTCARYRRAWPRSATSA
jgi:hypothetical protein